MPIRVVTKEVRYIYACEQSRSPGSDTRVSQAPELFVVEFCRLRALLKTFSEYFESFWTSVHVAGCFGYLWSRLSILEVR